MPSYEEWQDRCLTVGLPIVDTAFESFRNHFTQVEPESAYWEYCNEIKSQRELRNSAGREHELLTNAFDAFPKIKAIEFAAHNPSLECQDKPLEPWSLNKFARKTLMDRGPYSFHSHSGRQFRNMLVPAQSTAVNLEAITATGLNLRRVELEPAIMGEMNRAAAHTTRLRLGIEYSDVTYNKNIEWLARFIASAGKLCTMDLSFYSFPAPSSIVSFENDDRNGMFWPVNFAHLLRFRTHWPHLHTLRLDGLSAHENDFHGFLANHRENMRSLEFSDIMLKANAGGSSCCIPGSWVTVDSFMHFTIPLLRQKLKGLPYEEVDCLTEE